MKRIMSCDALTGSAQHDTPCQWRAAAHLPVAAVEPVHYEF